MKVTKLAIPDVLLLEPKVFKDDRGFFLESYNREVFRQATGLDVDFVQDNHSKSARGVLRGLHYQLPPAAQGKLIRVIAGEIYDVAVDMRRHSASFGAWVGQRLSAEAFTQMWIPEGFAHGFLVLSDTAEVLYKASSYYAPQAERAVLWDDPQLGIAWPSDGRPVLSDKDRLAPLFAQAQYF